jgi:hypothetical protein
MVVGHLQAACDLKNVRLILNTPFSHHSKFAPENADVSFNHMSKSVVKQTFAVKI